MLIPLVPARKGLADVGIIIVPNACDCSQEKCLALGMVHGQSRVSENCYSCDLLSSSPSFTLHYPDKQKATIKFSWIKHLLFLGIITKTK